jgi:hypothetical protein
MVGCSSVTDTLFAFDPEGGFTMRFAAEPVKLQFDHVGRLPAAANPR